MVARVWKGSTLPANAERYLAHLTERIFPGMRTLAGHAGVWVLQRPAGEVVEFIVMSVWQSREAVHAFAGHDIDVAVVPPEAQALLVAWDAHAVHYDIAVAPQG